MQRMPVIWLVSRMPHSQEIRKVVVCTVSAMVAIDDYNVGRFRYFSSSREKFPVFPLRNREHSAPCVPEVLTSVYADLNYSLAKVLPAKISNQHTNAQCVRLVL